MPVRKDEDGRRYVQAETEVPGTPEEVWDAIASGPGITSWFVPTRLDGRVGGTTVSSFGPGMDSLATITAWDPPHRFVAESPDEMGPGSRPVATEWIVEARGGGSCVVRVVHRWFADGDDWDNQFEGHTYGWQAFFRVLRLYLAHFAGQAGAPVQVMGGAPEPKDAAWEAWTRPLGLFGAEVGAAVRTPADAPPLAGTVAWAGQEAWPEELLIRLDEPAPGIAHLVPHAMGGQVYLTMRLYLFGEDAPSAAAEAQAAWQAWMDGRFASAVPAEGAA
jgi:uncharacterized protein YndB with AHSA1/START domain